MVERAVAWSSPFNEPVCGSSKDRIYMTTRPVLCSSCGWWHPVILLTIRRTNAKKRTCVIFFNRELCLTRMRRNVIMNLLCSQM